MATVDILNMDCMEYMATLPDKAFDLAIVDPPYGRGNMAVKAEPTALFKKWEGERSCRGVRQEKLGQ